MSQRRDFIKKMSLASAAVIAVPSFARSSIFTTDTIRVATIGVNGMGWANTVAALKVRNVQVVALCDIDGSVLNKRKQELSLLQPDVKQVDLYSDYRKILDRKDIDAVIVGTPDHWHALQTQHPHVTVVQIQFHYLQFSVNLIIGANMYLSTSWKLFI